MKLLPDSVDGRCGVCAQMYPDSPTTLLQVVWASWETDSGALPGYITRWTKINPYQLAELVPGTWGLEPHEMMLHPNVVSAKRRSGGGHPK